MAERFSPMRDGTYSLASPFGPRWGTVHRGLDFAAADGTPIYAAQAGRVVHIGASGSRTSGFGQWIVIDHPAAAGGGTTVYGHMWDAFATGLAVGAEVRAGQLIAYVGNNGGSTGPHLHFEVHPTVWRQGSQIDPTPWLRGARNPGSAPTPPPGGSTVVSGQLTWLADVVRPEVADFAEYPGWRSRGHGNFKDVRGVMIHHMGGRGGPKVIAEGRPDLAGPLSQFHVAQTGRVTVTAAGVGWHAGVGSYPWLPTNMGNWHLIGIECEGPVTPGITPATQHRERWPDPQIIALRNLCAALLLRSILGPDRLLGHKDYAGRAQGKWDPWNLDVTGWFAREVAKDMSGFVFPGERLANGPTPAPIPAPVPPADQYADILLHRGMSGPKVAKLQTALRRWYSKLAVDGDFGPATEAAVRDWQSLRPPLAADGVVGPATAARMGLVL